MSLLARGYRARRPGHGARRDRHRHRSTTIRDCDGAALRRDEPARLPHPRRDARRGARRGRAQPRLRGADAGGVPHGAVGGEESSALICSGLTTVNFDQIQHYRPRLNVVERPTRAAGAGRFAHRPSRDPGAAVRWRAARRRSARRGRWGRRVQSAAAGVDGDGPRAPHLDALLTIAPALQSVRASSLSCPRSTRRRASPHAARSCAELELSLDVLVVDDGSRDGTGARRASVWRAVASHLFNSRRRRGAADRLRFRSDARLRHRRPARRRRPARSARLAAVIALVADGRCDVAIGSRYVTAPSYHAPLVRRIGHGAVLRHRAHGAWAAHRRHDVRLPRLRARGDGGLPVRLPDDFLDAPLLITSPAKRLWLLEVPVQMREARARGRSFYTLGKSLYYPYKNLHRLTLMCLAPAGSSVSAAATGLRSRREVRTWRVGSSSRIAAPHRVGRGRARARRARPGPAPKAARGVLAVVAVCSVVIALLALDAAAARYRPRLGILYESSTVFAFRARVRRDDAAAHLPVAAVAVSVQGARRAGARAELLKLDLELTGRRPAARRPRPRRERADLTWTAG